MRRMMTWMMAAALFVAVSALPGCGSTKDGRNDGSGTKTQPTHDSGDTGSTDKNDSRKGSGSRY